MLHPVCVDLCYGNGAYPGHIDLCGAYSSEGHDPNSCNIFCPCSDRVGVSDNIFHSCRGNNHRASSRDRARTNHGHKRRSNNSLHSDSSHPANNQDFRNNIRRETTALPPIPLPALPFLSFGSPLACAPGVLREEQLVPSFNQSICKNLLDHLFVR